MYVSFIENPVYLNSTAIYQNPFFPYRFKTEPGVAERDYSRGSIYVHISNISFYPVKIILNTTTVFELKSLDCFTLYLVHPNSKFPGNR